MRDGGEQAARRLSLNPAPKPQLEKKLWANGPAPFRARPSPRPPAPTHQRTSCQRFSPGAPRPAMPGRPAALSLLPQTGAEGALAVRGEAPAPAGGAGRARGTAPGAPAMCSSRALLPTAPVGLAPRPWSLAGSPRCSAAAGRTTPCPLTAFFPHPLVEQRTRAGAFGALGEESGSPSSTGRETGLAP